MLRTPLRTRRQNVSYFRAMVNGHKERVYIGGDGQLWYWAGFEGQRTVANKDQALAWATKHADKKDPLLAPRLLSLEWSEGHRLGANRLALKRDLGYGRRERVGPAR